MTTDTRRESKPRVFSGVQPTGVPHIGTYLGAIRNWVNDQERYENFFCIVDLHALTVPQDPKRLREQTLELAALYYACGLDADHTRIFVQSHVPAHSELGWILQCFVPLGWLQRMTQFKERAESRGEMTSAGLFAYPALMAADILLYETQFVPVGDDQQQHIELARDVAERMNRRFGQLFVVPEALIPSVGSRIMGLDDPTKKMSKTVALERPAHAIALTDSPDTIRDKVLRAKTDSQSGIHFPADAGITNMLEIYCAFTGLSWPAVKEQFAGKPYIVLKRAIVETIVESVQPIQDRWRALRSDEPALIERLRQSAIDVETIAKATLRRVQETVGLRSP